MRRGRSGRRPRAGRDRRSVAYPVGLVAASPSLRVHFRASVAEQGRSRYGGTRTRTDRPPRSSTSHGTPSGPRPPGSSTAVGDRHAGWAGSRSWRVRWNPGRVLRSPGPAGLERWRARFDSLSWVVTRPALVVATATLLIGIWWGRSAPGRCGRIGLARRVRYASLAHVIAFAGLVVLTATSTTLRPRRRPGRALGGGLGGVRPVGPRLRVGRRIPERGRGNAGVVRVGRPRRRVGRRRRRRGDRPHLRPSSGIRSVTPRSGWSTAC